MIYFILLALSLNNAWASVSVLSPSERYKLDSANLKLDNNNKSKKVVEHRNYSNSRKIEEENIKLKELLSLRVTTPYVMDKTLLIRRGRYIPGKLIFSVLSTKIGSPVKVQLLKNPYLPEDTEIECEGISQDKSIDIYCNAALSDSFEYPLKARLLNADGTAGIRGLFYTGKEAYITGIVASEFAKGFLSIGQQTVQTPLGSMAVRNLSNQLLEGGVNTSNELTQIMKDEMTSKEPKVFVKRGTQVLVYFLETFSAKDQRNP